MARRATTARLHTRTAREIQAAPQGELNDGGGLILRVSANGASWVLRFTSPTGRRREMGLGIADRRSVAQAGASLTAARDQAHNARERLRQGLDPIDHRERQREAAQQAEMARKATVARERWTLARAARDYHERVIEPTRTTKHGAQWIASLELHVPVAVWHKPIDEIEPPELLTALSGVRSIDDKAERIPETQRRLRQRLDAVFEDAIFLKRCNSNPAAAVKRKLREQQQRQQSEGFAALPYREAAAFMTRLRGAPGVAARCLEFTMLTAARTSEALLAEWREFDLDGAVWTVPAERMKGRQEHIVHLPPASVAALHAVQGLDARYVFPSTVLDKRPMSNMAMLATLDRLGMRDTTTVHGLRATFSTWAYETGAARGDVIEACLAHREADKIKAAYNRAQFVEERRALLAAWAEYLDTPAAKVIPLRAA